MVHIFPVKTFFLFSMSSLQGLFHGHFLRFPTSLYSWGPVSLFILLDLDWHTGPIKAWAVKRPLVLYLFFYMPPYLMRLTVVLPCFSLGLTLTPVFSAACGTSIQNHLPISGVVAFRSFHSIHFSDSEGYCSRLTIIDSAVTFKYHIPTPLLSLAFKCSGAHSANTLIAALDLVLLMLGILSSGVILP